MGSDERDDLLAAYVAATHFYSFAVCGYVDSLASANPNPSPDLKRLPRMPEMNAEMRVKGSIRSTLTELGFPRLRIANKQFAA
jgi:hypothetical protein